MGGAGFPPYWLFGLRWPNSGAYLGSRLGLMVASVRVHAKEYFPELLLPVSLSSWWDTATPHLCRKPSNTSRYVWFSLLRGHCSFPWVPMHTLLCVCPPRVESLFPPVLLKSCNQIPLAFKVWFSKNSSSHCQTPRLGSLTWGSEPSLQWVHFCGITVLQFESNPPSSYGIWFYCDCTPPPSHCGFSFVFGCGVPFLVSSSVFLSSVVKQLETKALNDTLDKMDLIDIYRTFHPKTTEYTFFSSAHGTFSRIDHLLGHKSSLGKFKKIEIISSIFSNHKAMTLDINYRKKTVKTTNTWKLNNTLLNNQEITEEI